MVILFIFKHYNFRKTTESLLNMQHNKSCIETFRYSCFSSWIMYIFLFNFSLCYGKKYSLKCYTTYICKCKIETDFQAFTDHHTFSFCGKEQFWHFDNTVTPYVGLAIHLGCFFTYGPHVYGPLQMFNHPLWLHDDRIFILKQKPK